MTYDECRARYPEFIFESTDIQETETSLDVTYHFRTTGLADFHPHWSIPKSRRFPGRAADNETVRRLVFCLGMVELISYWKITCSPRVRVLAGCLDDDSIAFWKKQYFHGLGEFFYVNSISADPSGFMQLVSERKPSPAGSEEGLPLKGCLIPIGGGKDSAVTLELLREKKAENACFIINPRGATLETAAAAGYPDESVWKLSRSLDPAMLELNRQGFLNGHTPFSALVAFSSVLTAYLNGKQYVVLSNESSANESTVQGSEVNHQYSKSVEFEQDFIQFEAKHIGSGVSYFSLLRPWSEFQIARYFASLTQYHAVFRSCNVGSKQDIWCGHCPKCLFVALILSPFLSSVDLTAIFGRNLLDDASLIPLLEKLTGILPEKPFECVGSRDEVNTAVCMTIARMEREGEKLPALLAHYRSQPIYAQYCGRCNTFEHYFDHHHFLPAEFEQILRRECGC